MPLQVVDHYHGNVQGQRKRLGEGGAHQQRPQQARAAGESDGRKPGSLHAGPFQCFGHHGDNVLFVGTGRKFGHDAAKVLVDLLRGDYIGQQDAVPDHGGGSVVARRFYAKDDICHFFPEFDCKDSNLLLFL